MSPRVRLLTYSFFFLLGGAVFQAADHIDMRFAGAKPDFVCPVILLVLAVFALFVRHRVQKIAG